MYRNLPSGVKRSISHSVNKAFKLYMENIGWDDNQYDSEQFIKFWHDYSKKQAAWVKGVDTELFNQPEFQEELTAKVNEIIKTIIETEPTTEQMETIDELVKGSGIDDVDYCCKAEAEYWIEKLSK